MKTYDFPGDVAAMRRRMNRLLAEFHAGAPWSVPGYSPPVDLLEGAGMYVVRVELPGVDAGSLRVEYADQVLTIEGEKPAIAKEEGKTFHWNESAHGRFRRRVPLPGAVDASRIEAEGHAGVVTITVPKVSPPRRIEIRAK
jgi:HSP20 family protein